MPNDQRGGQPDVPKTKGQSKGASDRKSRAGQEDTITPSGRFTGLFLASFIAIESYIEIKPK